MAWLSIEVTEMSISAQALRALRKAVDVVVLGDLRISCTICCSYEGLAGKTEACGDARSRVEPFPAAPCGSAKVSMEESSHATALKPVHITAR